jgi:hypothetical protein
MKNRNIPYYVAALMLAAGVSTSFVSCVDTDEPSSIEKLREAKANEVNAQAAYKNALAQTQLQTAEIQKQKAAQAAIDTQIKEIDKQIKESGLAVYKKQHELAILMREDSIAHEKAAALVTAEKDAKDLDDAKVKAIDAALTLETKVAEKEAELKYLKEKAAADLDDKYAKLNRQIEETKVKLKQIELDYSIKADVQTDSVLIAAAKTDEIAQNLLTAKTNSEGLLTATFDAWIQAKFNVIKAQATLAEEQYKAAVSTVKDTISLSLAEATSTAQGGVETQKLAVAAAEDNLAKLQELKDKTDYQSWLKAYNDADNYIKVDIENKQTARKTTLADKKIQKTAADNAVAKAEDAYKDYTKPFQKKLDDYDAKSAFYKYDISAADYATLVSYITDKKGNWKGKITDGYDIEQAKVTKADGQKFIYDAASKQFVSIEQEIKNSDFKTAIAELYAVDDADPENQEKITGVIGQFIAKTKADNTSKKDAEQTLKDQEKNIFRSENVATTFTPTDDRALVYTFFDAKKKYEDAFTNLRSAKTNYNNAVASVETTKKTWENAQKALDDNTDPTKTAGLTTARDNAKQAYDNAVAALDADDPTNNKIGVKQLLIGSSVNSEKYPGAIPTYNKCVTAFDNACKALFGDKYADKKNKFAKTLVTDKDLDDTKHQGVALYETVEGKQPVNITSNNIDNAPRYVFDLPDRLTADALSVILEGKTLTDYEADIYNNDKFGIANSVYVKYLRQKNVVVPEWANKIKADEEAAKFVSTVKSHVNVADAATAELSIVETLNQLVADRAKLQTAVYEARYTEEGKKLLAEVESKKATQSAAADSVAKYDEYDKVTNPKGLVDQAIKEEKAAKEELKTLYKGLIEAAFKKAASDNTYTYDAEKYAETYAKAEIKLEKALADAKADLAVAEAKLEAAKKGEVYTPAGVTSPIVYVSKGTDGKYIVLSSDQTILASGKTYEAYIEALQKAVTETQANVDDLNKQYEAAKKLYEEVMAQVAEFNKAK